MAKQWFYRQVVTYKHKGMLELDQETSQVTTVDLDIKQSKLTNMQTCYNRCSGSLISIGLSI